jgi:hypothetical protein
MTWHIAGYRIKNLVNMEYCWKINSDNEGNNLMKQEMVHRFLIIVVYLRHARSVEPQRAVGVVIA